jgi:hypothetical protein
MLEALYVFSRMTVAGLFTLPPLGEGGAKRRMRALPRVQWASVRVCCKTLIRPSGTFSRWEKGEVGGQLRTQGAHHA